jgi:hypothetical protein
MTTTTTEKRIHARAMLVRLSVSVWNGRRFDRKISEEVTREHGASEESGRWNKHLLGGRKAAPSHARTISSAGAMRVVFYAETLPWADEGWRLLPTSNYDVFVDRMRKARARFDADVETFLSDYPGLREKARALLNGMYREGDYPAEHELRSRYGVGIEFSPVPAEGDFRLDLPADQVADIERTTAARVERATADAMRSAWDRLRETVRKLRIRLADTEAREGKGAIFRDSLIENVREVCDVLTRLNVTDDPGLESVRAAVSEELASLNPAALRDFPSERQAAVRKADDILSRMSELYGGAK